MQRTARVGSACALFLLVLAAAAQGCATPAQAEPLEVTYYYLPG